MVSLENHSISIQELTMGKLKDLFIFVLLSFSELRKRKRAQKSQNETRVKRECGISPSRNESRHLDKSIVSKSMRENTRKIE